MKNELLYTPFNPLRILHYRERINKLLNGEICPPITISFDFSNFCNHDCIWCAWKKYRLENNGFLSPRVMDLLLDDPIVKDVKGWEICGGGEPLLNPHAELFINKLRQTNKPILLVTNGSRLTENIAKNVDQIRVSLDAATAKTHKSLHGNDDFDTIVENIEMAASRTNVGLGFLLTPQNIHEVVKFTLLARSWGVQRVQIRPCYTDYDMVRDTIGFDWFDFSRRFEEDIKKLLDKVKKLSTDNFEVLTTFYKIMPRRWTFPKCYALTLNPLVDPSGGVWICCERRNDQQSKIGEISENVSFTDLWFSKKHVDMIKNLPDKNCPFKCKYVGYNKAIYSAYVDKKLNLGWV
ncbi:MAG: radical SAM/SPASM domain-containing protein [Promethearchaeota archaeon]